MYPRVYREAWEEGDTSAQSYLLSQEGRRYLCAERSPPLSGRKEIPLRIDLSLLLIPRLNWPSVTRRLSDHLSVLPLRAE